MSIQYIRKTYDVPANLGGRVRYTGGREPRDGTIMGTEGAYLMLKLDGDRLETGPYHPTWEIEYLPRAQVGEADSADKAA